jgi:hypothetical protein
MSTTSALIRDIPAYSNFKWVRYQNLEGPFELNGKQWHEDETCRGRFVWAGPCKYNVRVIRLATQKEHMK